MDTIELLKSLTALTGVAGDEKQATQYCEQLLKKYGKTEITPLGSLICTVNPPREGKPHLLLDAHIDEIGMVVTYIEESGFLRVAPCGGIDRRVLMASTVTIHNDSEKIVGVVCSTPPHLAGEEDKKNKKTEEVYIDIGFGGEKAREKVSLGDKVTLNSSPRDMLNGILSSKATDDRVGCVAILKSLEYLAGAELECGLSVVFSTMEEVGGQGAKTAADIINPTHAIGIDVSFAFTPDSSRERCGEMGKGTMIGYAPILSHSMSNTLCSLAKENDIAYQLEVMSGKTGTNIDHVATVHRGVICGLLSIPQKYMHTPIEMVKTSDIEATARLIASYTKTLGRV